MNSSKRIRTVLCLCGIHRVVGQFHHRDVTRKKKKPVTVR